MDGVVRKTYYFNGKAVAVRNGDTLEYIHNNHLGSLVLMYLGLPK